MCFISFPQNNMYVEMQNSIWQAVGQWQQECQEAMGTGSNKHPVLPPLTIRTNQTVPPIDDYIMTNQSSPIILNGNYDYEDDMLVSPSNTASSSASLRGGWIQVDKLDFKRSSKYFMNLSCSLQPGLREDHV